MKKLLLALFLAIAAPAFGASVTLSNGAACEYSGVAIGRLGNIVVTCVATATPTDPTPVPQPPAAPPGKYAGSGVWLYQNRQIRTGSLQAGDEREAPFTIPSGYAGSAEIGISGLNLKVFIDGIEYADGAPVPSLPGPHVLKIRAVGSAEGTITLYHAP